MPNNDLISRADSISRAALLAAYDAAHKGPPGGARKLIEEAPGVDGWVSVKDRLPEIGERVLVFGVGKHEHFVGSTMTAITCMSDANLIDCRLKTQPYWLEPWQYYLTDYEITHLMPLPEPPKEDDDDDEVD